MEGLYKVSTKYSYEEYKKFNEALLKKRHTWTILIGCSILILLVGAWVKENWMILFALFYPLFFYLIQQYNIKKIYESNKLNAEMDIHYEFFPDYFTEGNQMGEVKIPYEKLSEIIETKTNFYLMIAKNQGFMLSKENMEEGLISFLKEKMGNLDKAKK